MRDGLSAKRTAATSGTSGAEMGDADFSDGRLPGHFETRYPRKAWVQITIEAVYSLMIFAVAGLHLVAIASAASRKVPIWDNCWFFRFAGIEIPSGAVSIGLWSVVFFSGMIGSNVLVTKWLYHSVAASWTWNTDRLLWRIFVPIQGGVLAVFVGLMSLGGFLSTNSDAVFSSFAKAAGFGFFFGLLADNVVSALQRIIRAVLQQVVSATSRALGQSSGESGDRKDVPPQPGSDRPNT